VSVINPQSRLFHYIAIFCLSLVVAIRAKAEPPIARKAPGPAELRLTAESQGRIRIDFTLFTLPAEPGLFEKIVGDVVASALEDVDWDIDPGREVVTMRGLANEHFARGKIRVHGQMDLDPLKKALEELKVPLLTLQLIHPRAEFSQFTTGNRTSGEADPLVRYEYNSAPSSAVSKIDFEFGYRRETVLRKVMMLAAIGLLLLAAGAAVGRNPRVQSERPMIWLTLGSWAVWIAALYWLKIDLLSSFILGVDLEWGAVLLIATTMLPLMIFSMAHGFLVEKTLALSNAKRPITLLLPTVMVAAAILSQRNLENAKALQWLGSALIVAAVLAGLAIWASSDPSVEAFGQTKRKGIKRWIFADLFSSIVFPALSVFLIHKLQLQDTARPIAYVGTLALSLVLLTIWRRKAVAPFPNRTVPWIVIAAEFLLISALAIWACVLLDFSFRLTSGDEAWAMLLIALANTFLGGMFQVPGATRLHRSRA
jgi:hypothetical protein